VPQQFYLNRDIPMLPHVLKPVTFAVALGAISAITPTDPITSNGERALLGRVHGGMQASGNITVAPTGQAGGSSALLGRP
jgi:hypothetical protein